MKWVTTGRVVYFGYSLAGHEVINEIYRLETFANISFALVAAKFGRHQSDWSGHMTIYEYMLWNFAPCESAMSIYMYLVMYMHR